MLSTVARSLAIGFALAAFSVNSAAVMHTLSLTGVIANATTDAFDNGQVTFDQALFSYTVTVLEAPVSITSSSLGYNLFSAVVPEPGPAMLLAAGLAVLGLRRRQAP
jgi:hypothetical protein